MSLGAMVTGGLVGMFLGMMYTGTVAGQNYGAGRWQHPRSGRFVKNHSGFVRWLSVPVFTAIGGAILGNHIFGVLQTFVSSLSDVETTAFALGTVALLYMVFIKFEL